MLFELDEEVPEEQLRDCVELALSYHKVKYLPLLGAEVYYINTTSKEHRYDKTNC